MRAVLRRNYRRADSEEQGENGYRFGSFHFDPERRTLLRANQEIELSRAEMDLLNVFVHHPGRVLSRDFIMESLAGNERDPFDRSVDVRVTRLRHKIEADPTHPKFIKTVWGVGYQFNAEPVVH